MKMQKEFQKNDQQQKKSVQWFIYVILIPLLFAITVALVVSSFAGVNVFNLSKDLTGKLPFFGNTLSKSSSTAANKNAEKDVISLQAQLSDDEAKISQLQSQLDSKDQEIQRAKLENNRIQQEMDSLTASQKESKRALSDLVATYEAMSAKKAAPIVAKMSDAEALKILTTIKPEILASIMENMDPAQAARFTELMTNKNDPTQTAAP